MTPQVCYLEKYLQIKFGDNSIRVIDASSVEQYAFLSSEDTDVIDNYIDMVVADGGEVNSVAILIKTLTALGYPEPIGLYLYDEGTILYTSFEMNTARFVVQVSQAVYDAFSESIKSTISKFRLPGFAYIFQVI
jgi:hypothetical protein